MNNLSWLLYWADVLPSLATTICVISILGTIISGYFTLIYFTAGFGDWTHDQQYLARFRFSPHLAGLFLFLAVFSNIVPSKDTFYLIASSEAGEQALKTPEVTKVRQVINKWLDEQVKSRKSDCTK